MKGTKGKDGRGISLRGTQARLALTCFFLLGLSVQSWRVLSAWKESRALEAEIGALSSELTQAARNGASNLPQPGRGVPLGQLPGPVLLDAVRLLNAAEIYDYRYRFVPPPAPPSTDAPTSDGAASDLAIPPPEATPNGEATSDDPASDDASADDADWPALELPNDPVAPPGEWKEWRLELDFAAAYPRLLNFLDALRADDRVWVVPRLVATRESGMLSVDLVLKTYTRSPDATAAPAPTGASAHASVDLAPDLWNESMRDPFRSARLPRAEGVHLSTPSLGGVLRGTRNRAWLDGRAVAVGGRVGAWTLSEIRDGEVVLRHDGGAVVRLKARGGSARG